MIRKLRLRFIRLALITLTAAMVAVVLAVNAVNWISVRNELRDTLVSFAEFGGNPERDGFQGKLPENWPEGKRDRHARSLFNESSWFIVTLDSEGEVLSKNLLNMHNSDESLASGLALEAAASGKESGFLQDYLFLVRESPRGRDYFFMDCETRLAAVRKLALFSGLACLGGILLAALAVTLASRKAIEPTIRNMEQQKQFITNASHELKTPLTVISTNMELLQMEMPDSQWIRSTRKQTAQMRHLVDELVYLSRMEEEGSPLEMENLTLDSLLAEAAEPFIAMAEFQGKAMTAEAEKGLTLRGDRASVQRLLSTLLDNAVKYTPPEGTIRAEARSEGRHAVITVSNDVAEPLSEEQCRRLFNRFYRADDSRNKEKQNGFGIGLAIAAAIAEKHGGTISAAMKEDRQLVFTCRLPK